MTVQLRSTQRKTSEVRQEYRRLRLLAQTGSFWSDLDEDGKFINVRVLEETPAKPSQSHTPRDYSHSIVQTSFRTLILLYFFLSAAAKADF